MPPAFKDSIARWRPGRYDAGHTRQRLWGASLKPLSSALLRARERMIPEVTVAPQPNDSPDKLDRAEVVAERLMTALRSLPMFRGLSQQDRERVARVAVLRDYDRGEFLWRAGDPADHLTLIVRGQVKMRTTLGLLAKVGFRRVLTPQCAE